MDKKRFFDDRLKYLSFIQNTGEKKAISEQIYSHIAGLSENKSYLRILDAGTGDGTIYSNIIKSFHRYHPYASLLMMGKEISYEDLKNTLEKMPDRFVEHPNLLITMTNVRFSELGLVESSNKIKDKNWKNKLNKFKLDPTLMWEIAEITSLNDLEAKFKIINDKKNNSEEFLSAVNLKWIIPKKN